MSHTALRKHSRKKPSAAMACKEFLATDFANPHVELVNRKVITAASITDEIPVQDSYPKMTYAEFLKHDFENPHVEWVNGRVIAMAPISDEHQDIGGLLEAVLRAFAEEKKLGTVRHDPFQMKLGGDLPGRGPDILFLATAHKSRLKKTFVKGPADLVVEIIIPDGRARDRGEKFYEYEKGGVPEFWLIDPERKQAEFYLRHKRGIYEVAKLDAKGIFHSWALPGVWINPNWFWSKPLPSMISIQRLWGLVK